MKDMSLNLEYIHIKDVVFGEKTFIEDGVLTVNKDELIETVKSDRLTNIDVDIAKPGETVSGTQETGKKIAEAIR